MYLQDSNDDESCHYTRWVDPPVEQNIQDYIYHLQDRIFDLQREADAILSPPEEDEPVIQIDDPTVCLDHWCPYPCHQKYAPPPPPAPPPAHYGDGGCWESRESS